MTHLIEKIYSDGDKVVAEWNRWERVGRDYFYNSYRDDYFSIGFYHGRGTYCSEQFLDNYILCHKNIGDRVVGFYQEIGLTAVGIYLSLGKVHLSTEAFQKFMLCHKKIGDPVVGFYQELGLSVIEDYLPWSEWFEELV